MNTELIMKTATGVVVERILDENLSGRNAFIIGNGDYHDVVIALTADILSVDPIARQIAKDVKEMMSNCERWYVKGTYSDGSCKYDIVTNDEVCIDYRPFKNHGSCLRTGGSYLRICSHNNDNTDKLLIEAAYDEHNEQEQAMNKPLFEWPDDWDPMDL